MTNEWSWTLNEIIGLCTLGWFVICFEILLVLSQLSQIYDLLKGEKRK